MTGPQERKDFTQAVFWLNEESERTRNPVNYTSIETPIYRTQRIAGETYPFRPAVLSAKDRRRFGNVRLRFDWGTVQGLTPEDELEFVSAVFEYGKLYVQIQDLLTKQIPHAETIRRIRRRYPGLRGGILEKLGKTVTDVTSVDLSPEVGRIKQALGNSLPEVGAERVGVAVVLRSNSVSGEDIIRVFKLGLMFLGINAEEAQKRKDLLFKIDMKVENRDRLIELANLGVVPRAALNPDPKDSLHVEEIVQRLPRKRSSASKRAP